MIPVYSPLIEPYTGSAHDALNSGWISSQGPYVQKTVEKMKSLMGVKHVILTNSGTSATHMLMLSIRLKYPQVDTIYVPNHVFVAPWNAALYEFPKSAIRVMDIDKDTLNIRVDEEYIAGLQTNSAVLIVHNVGNVVNVPRLKRIRPDLVFVEDNCEGFLGTYEGHMSGTASLCSAVSFFANKNITCGEGGAYFTNDDELAVFVQKSCQHGMTSERYVHDVLGYNVNMTNIQAALLYDQLMDIRTICAMKSRVFYHYETKLREAGIDFRLPVREPETVSSNWMFTIQLPNRPEFKVLQSQMKNEGIDIRPFFYDIRVHRHLEDIPVPPGATFSETVVMLPSSPTLTGDEIKRVVEGLRKALEYIQCSQ